MSILKGLTERVNLIAFSTDERFVCACGEVSSSSIFSFAMLMYITNKIFNF